MLAALSTILKIAISYFDLTFINSYFLDWRYSAWKLQTRSARQRRNKFSVFLAAEIRKKKLFGLHTNRQSCLQTREQSFISNNYVKFTAETYN